MPGRLAVNFNFDGTVVTASPDSQASGLGYFGHHYLIYLTGSERQGLPPESQSAEEVGFGELSQGLGMADVTMNKTRVRFGFATQDSSRKRLRPSFSLRRRNLCEAHRCMEFDTFAGASQP
jgi:hypothetical protein